MLYRAGAAPGTQTVVQGPTRGPIPQIPRLRGRLARDIRVWCVIFHFERRRGAHGKSATATFIFGMERPARVNGVPTSGHQAGAAVRVPHRVPAKLYEGLQPDRRFAPCAVPVCRGARRSHARAIDSGADWGRCSTALIWLVAITPPYSDLPGDPHWRSRASVEGGDTIYACST